MSSHQFVAVNGHRVEITGLKSFWEDKCEGCGEYAASGSLTEITASVINAYVNIPRVLVHMHADCLGTHGETIGKAVSEAVANCPPF